MLNQTLLEQCKHLHFIGIGGSGMFPIVQILHGMGFRITGSDNNEGDIITAEREMGISVTLGQRAENIAGADLIVYTAAILPDNPELLAAQASGVPLVERSEMLGLLTRLYPDCYGISGTHGKTTTSAMLTQMLFGAGLDPSAVIGGKLPAIGGYGRRGESGRMVCESCEFQDHFLKLSPAVSVILNIDNDHMEYFKTMDNMIASYRTFAQKASRAIIYNGDDENTLKAVGGLSGRQLISFGWEAGNDYQAADWCQEKGVRSSFELLHHGKSLGRFTLNVPGQHNVLDACAALACAFDAGLSPAQAAEHLAAFHGAGRRFEVLGEVGGFTVADDYAHHPTELEATLRAARALPFGAVWAVFQPFTYSRTRLLMDDFARALSLADHVVMSEIMGSREVNTDGVYTSQLAEKIEGSVWFPTFPEIAQYVREHARPGDLVITLGCGDVYKCAKLLLTL